MLFAISQHVKLQHPQHTPMRGISKNTSIRRLFAARTALPPRSLNQRRWARVYDARYLATQGQQDRIFDRYREKLGRKAKEWVLVVYVMKLHTNHTQRGSQRHRRAERCLQAENRFLQARTSGIANDAQKTLNSRLITTFQSSSCPQACSKL
jgi:hypothetical protein